MNFFFRRIWWSRSFQVNNFTSNFISFLDSNTMILFFDRWKDAEVTFTMTVSFPLRIISLSNVSGFWKLRKITNFWFWREFPVLKMHPQVMRIMKFLSSWLFVYFYKYCFFLVLLTLFIWLCKVYNGWNSTGQVLYDGKVSSSQNSGQIVYSVNQKMMIKFTIVQFIPSPTVEVFNSTILHWNVATVKQI